MITLIKPHGTSTHDCLSYANTTNINTKLNRTISTHETESISNANKTISYSASIPGNIVTYKSCVRNIDNGNQILIK